MTITNKMIMTIILNKVECLSMARDFYDSNAEWYAALAAASQESTDAALRTRIGPLTGGDAIDLASGTGSCLPALLGLGADRIFAVEPSRAMRAGLMTTVAGDSELMRRTTIIPAPFPDALKQLPPQWSAAVMFNAIGHLDDDARLELWATLAERLAPGGRFVMTLQPPEKVTAVPWTDFGEVTVGEHRIITRGRAEPFDETRVLWTIEWTLVDRADEVITARTATHSWRALSRRDIAVECREAGLVVIDGDADPAFVTITRR